MTDRKASPNAAAGANSAETAETPPAAETAAAAAPDLTAEADCASAKRRVEADNIVKNHVMVALSFGLVPVPLFDLALLTGNQVSMASALSELYGLPFEKQKVHSIVIALVSSALPVLGVIGLSSGAKLIPGIGSLFGSGVVAVTGGAVTYGVGQVFIAHFESGGSLLDLDPAKMRALFKQEVRNGKAVAAEALGQAKPEAVPS